MNNRFKFRVWNKEDKKMCEAEGVYGYTDETTNGGEVFAKGYKTSFYFPEEVEVMQCTGLKDKNGKLIYEGDILQENWHKYILEWVNGTYVIKDIKNGTSYIFTAGMCIHKSEVIGNIYENKELLNE